MTRRVECPNTTPTLFGDTYRKVYTPDIPAPTDVTTTTRTIVTVRSNGRPPPDPRMENNGAERKSQQSKLPITPSVPGNLFLCCYSDRGPVLINSRTYTRMDVKKTPLTRPSWKLRSI